MVSTILANLEGCQERVLGGRLRKSLIDVKERCQPMDMSETRADSSFPLNTPWPWTSPCEGLSESNLSIPKSTVDRGQHSSLPSGIIRDRQFSAKSGQI